MILSLSGTPGTGKTYMARELDIRRFTVVPMNHLSTGYVTGHDPDRGSHEVDVALMAMDIREGRLSLTSAGVGGISPPTLPGGVPGGVPAGGVEGVPDWVTEVVPDGVPEGIQGGTPRGVPGELPEGIQGGVHGGVPGELPEGIQGGVHGGVPGELPEGIQGGTPRGVPGELPEGIQGGVHGGVPGELPEGIQGGVHGGVPGELPEGIQGGVHGGGPDGAPDGGYGHHTVIEGHLSHHLPAHIIVVLRTSVPVLRGRLEERGYPREKVLENLEAEALGVITLEALDTGQPVYEIDTSVMSPAEAARRCEAIIRERPAPLSGPADMIDLTEGILTWY